MDFEKSFEEFIDGQEYDRAAGTLFAMTRIAFRAGWIAAEKGISAQPVVQLIQTKPEEE
ncbi:hypothetical protein U6B65_08035 [Oscillospiraceae bacterium MB08-C2-2]|nr:hypothetical protein U6B65_08035 [Oscillospiraceae bacterium MB08-C2-2]